MNFGIKVVIGFLAFGLSRLAGVPIEYPVAFLMVFAIGWPIGWMLGSLISVETDVDADRFKLIGWANLIAWLFPIAGVAIAKLTSKAGEESMKNRLFYDGLSILGYGLVIVSVSLSIPMIKAEMANANGASPNLSYSDHSVSTSTERSYARCPYAAIEGWSAAEIQEYCAQERTE